LADSRTADKARANQEKTGVTEGPTLSPHREKVRPEWVDYNGHMNVAYYVMVFDHGTDRLLDHLGLGRIYRDADGRSVFVVEAHVTYDRELKAGDEVAVSSRILGRDDKRLHVFHEMRRVDDEALAATSELLFLHVDMSTRSATPFPDAAKARIDALIRMQSGLPLPDRAGRAIGLGTKRPAGG
jgi:acyl-CoA thioester hydrolase